MDTTAITQVTIVALSLQKNNYFEIYNNKYVANTSSSCGCYFRHQN